MISCETSGTKWEDLLWRIEMFFPDIPSEILAQSLRASGSKFIRKSRVIKRWIEFDAQRGVEDYPIELEDCYMPVGISQVKVVTKPCTVDVVDYIPDECECGPIEVPTCDCSCEEVDPEEIIYNESDEAFSDGCENRFWFENGWLNLSPAPQGGTVKVYLSVAPSLRSCEIPVEIAEEYGDVIANEARINFLLMRDEEWYDPDEAKVLRLSISGAIADASYKRSNRRPRRQNYMRGRCESTCR